MKFREDHPLFENEKELKSNQERLELTKINRENALIEKQKKAADA